ncbi:dolichyl-P-Man:Man(7)GlcNAc(2)-PP-dolichol alpha-1,6-mannosyltransferase [Sporobolomyces salmoneus]|uniref:dolichyl-P-Man:Man(7)GlcNAc(2)-PP-dolichol alpha-1,6-mannosyltransferase n=1 Tax=Sporobolomyces salmoneus TaxID=183962 RepID=UPI00317CAED0
MLEPLLLLSSTIHVLLAPYTKVEESFTLHAVRDLLLKGVNKEAISQYDHVEFPGAVPRSFVGPGMLSVISYPFVRIADELGMLRSGYEVQILIRLVLALVPSLSLIFLARRVRYAFGAKVARAFVLISATQFHLPFWISRTVPNMIAFPLVQCAIALLIASPKVQLKKTNARLPLFAFAIFTFAALVLRLELGALLAAFASEQLVRGTIGFVPLVTCGLVSAVASLACTMAVDSFFWQKPIDSFFWPEGSSFFFNVVQGKASDWGTSPFYTYFALSLPKLLLLALPFAFISLFVDRRARRIGIPALVYVGILSGLQHKEWRFISYVVPVLNICAASGIQAIGALFASKKLRRACLAAIVTVNTIFTILGVLASRNNYPGGEAIRVLESLVQKSGRTGITNVHVSSHAAMNGASSFLLTDSPFSVDSDSPWYLTQRNKVDSPTSRVAYSKSESPILDSPQAFADASESFDYLMVDATDSTYPSEWVEGGLWKVVAEVNGFGGFGKLWRGEKFGTKEVRSVGILERLR